jgi:hypothetical protein
LSASGPLARTFDRQCSGSQTQTRNVHRRLRDDRTLDAFAMSPSISARTAAHASLLSIHDVQQRFDARETCGNKPRPASRDGLIRSTISRVKRFVALFMHEHLLCFSLRKIERIGSVLKRTSVPRSGERAPDPARESTF